nr:hypothetical protein [Aquitalea magnusonii]
MRNVVDQGNQVGDADVLAQLGQQGGGLTAMMGLVVEEVQQKGVEVLALRDATGVVIGQRLIKIAVVERAA